MMNVSSPNDLPFLHGGPVGTAVFKAEPEDFLVEEILGFEPSGEGEHCLVWVEKTDIDSNEAARRLAEAAGIRRRLVSHCGLKDRHAVTRQWFSLHLPGQPSPVAVELASEGLRVLKVTRNQRKLRRGTHTGNRFTIRLRNPDIGADAARERWRRIGERGAPNYFGPQRFGNGGQNVEKALAMFRGAFVPRDRDLRGLLISSARSFLFNAVVAARVSEKCWDRVMDGEVFGFSDNRSIILPEKQRGDERERFENGTLELTAPLWGRGELQSEGEVRGFEERVIGVHSEVAEGLESFGLNQERRVIRVRPGNPEFEVMADGDFRLCFDLPKGTYATALLREIVEFAGR